jgi:CheY-like chemotaxis protein
MNSATPIRSLRVLIVDDVADGADSLAQLVDLWGHEARVARDSAAALTAVAAFRPHVIFLDVTMYGMSGGEVAFRLPQQPDLQTTVLVATTSHDQDDPRLAAYNGLFHHFLRKPHNLARPEQLLGSCVPRTVRDDLAPLGTAAGP